MIIGYKGTYNFTCINHKFEIGETYELPGIPIMCHYGFHYCTNAINVLTYYPIMPDFKLLEIEDLGESYSRWNKSVTNKLRVIREVPIEECEKIFNKQIEIFENEVKITDPDGHWEKHQFDKQRNRIYFESSTGRWVKRKFNENNDMTYEECSSGFRTTMEYCSSGCLTSKTTEYLNSDGTVMSVR
jgi:hypothetical protein